MSGEFTEPWRVEAEEYGHENGSSWGYAVKDANDLDVIHASGHFCGSRDHRERIVRCVNALESVGDETIDSPDDLRRLCLAVLRADPADDLPVQMLADEAQARAGLGAGYVRRGDLLAALWKVLGRMGAEAPGDPRYYCHWNKEDQDDLLRLLHAADPELAWRPK